MEGIRILPKLNLLFDECVYYVGVNALVIILSCLVMLKTFTSKVMFEKEIFIRPFLQIIRTFDVARKGLPRPFLQFLLLDDRTNLLE